MTETVGDLKNHMWIIYGQHTAGLINDDHARYVLCRRLEDELSSHKTMRVIRKFCVVCDKTNNPPEVVENNDLVVTIVLTDAQYQQHTMNMNMLNYAEWVSLANAFAADVTRTKG